MPRSTQCECSPTSRWATRTSLSLRHSANNPETPSGNPPGYSRDPYPPHAPPAPPRREIRISQPRRPAAASAPSNDGATGAHTRSTTRRGAAAVSSVVPEAPRPRPLPNGILRPAPPPAEVPQFIYPRRVNVRYRQVRFVELNLPLRAAETYSVYYPPSSLQVLAS